MLVDRELVSTQAALQVLSLSPHLQDQRLADFDKQARTVLGQGLTVVNIVLSDPSGQQVVNTLRPYGSVLPMHANPDQLREVVRTGQPRVSDLYRVGVTRQWLVGIDVPVKQGERVIYDISMGILPEQLASILAQQWLPKGAIAVIFDRQGRIIARTAEMKRFLGSPGASSLLARMRTAPEGALEMVSLERIPLLLGYSRSGVSGWTVALGTPVAQLDAPYLEAMRGFLIALPMLMIVFLGIAIYIGHRISKPIRALVEPAMALSTGNHVVVESLGLKEADEVGLALSRTAAILADANRLASHDALTGMPNRLHFDNFVIEQLAVAVRESQRFSVLYIDLDGFKRVNDLHGHAVGDELLLSVAERLRGVVRGADVVARMGGDEFAAALPNTGSTGAAQVACKVIDALSMPFMLTTATVAISASVGIACYPESGDDAASLMRRADMAMYAAKDAGKGRYVVAEPHSP